MGERFVSGLPDACGPEAPDPHGLALLARIRAGAEADLRTLAPLTQRRFDGVERIEPDPADVAAHATAAALERLIDVILADPALCRRLAAALVARVPR